MNKKLNSNSSAGTTADSDKTPKIPTSSHDCSNTFVVRSPNVEAAEKEHETNFFIENIDTKQTISLNGQIVVYLGNRHIHMKGSELVDIMLEKSNQAAPKIGVKQKFGVFTPKNDGTTEISVVYGMMTENGIRLD